MKTTMRETKRTEAARKPSMEATTRGATRATAARKPSVWPRQTDLRGSELAATGAGRRRTAASAWSLMAFKQAHNAEITGAPPRAPGKRANADGASG